MDKLLFRIWNGEDSRATRGIGFLAFANNSSDSLSEIAIVIIRQCTIEDGMSFEDAFVEAWSTKEAVEFEGVRSKFNGLTGKARVRTQLDIVFDDVVHSVVGRNSPGILG